MVGRDESDIRVAGAGVAAEVHRQRALELEQQGFRVELAHNERYPSVTIGPYYSEEKSNGKDRFVGVGVSLPLPLWNHNRGNVETAAARQEQAQTSLHVAQRVKARVKEIQSKLPDGVEMQLQYDRSELIDRTIGTVKKNLFEGAILVVVILLLLLGNWRAALIVALAIPLSFLFALMGMERFGIAGPLSLERWRF